MPQIDITPDQIVYFKWGFATLNATILFTWVVMALLVTLAWLTTRRLGSGRSVTRRQTLFEMLITFMRSQIREITDQDPDRYLPFIGSLFLFISVSNLLEVVPGYHAPTGSINTTAALALVVFFAVPIFGVAEQGLLGYLKHYAQPTPLMLPFNIIGELSRTLALAVRLFGNVMSGALVVAVLVAIVPIFVPIVMEALGLLIGQVQAYIFAVLATVYIGAATRRDNEVTKAVVHSSPEVKNG
ncbi:MAG: F0F1 ATP synthase subunit A [Dehalococcoidia bacterium]|nr:F0F1 ATP synthase subunit A [Dehalococcoidia bacterium]